MASRLDHLGGYSSDGVELCSGGVEGSTGVEKKSRSTLDKPVAYAQYILSIGRVTVYAKHIFIF